MRHTVIGVFDTFAQAEDARSALVAAGFMREDVELQANPQRDDMAEPSVTAGAQPHADQGVLANIERFFSMLFGGREHPPEVAHYSEAVRRGAVLVAVEAIDESQADIARTTLSDQGAIDIDERAASWGTLGNTGDRDHSVLDELGLGRGSGVPGREPVNDPLRDPLNDPAAMRADLNRTRAYPRSEMDSPVGSPISEAALNPAMDPLAGRDELAPLEPHDPIDLINNPSTPVAREGVRDPLTGVRVDDPMIDPLNDTPQRDPLTGATTRAPLSAATTRDPLTGTSAASAASWRPVNTLDETEASANDPLGMASDAPLGGTPARVPDEYMEYEDDFRSDYDSKYAATGSRYEDYEGAYRYGATAGRDTRFHGRNWDDEMETELRQDWHSRDPAAGDTWDRFKAAIRHGWDRVTGHHHV